MIKEERAMLSIFKTSFLAMKKDQTIPHRPLFSPREFAWNRQLN